MTLSSSVDRKLITGTTDVDHTEQFAKRVAQEWYDSLKVSSPNSVRRLAEFIAAELRDGGWNNERSVITPEATPKPDPIRGWVAT